MPIYSRIAITPKEILDSIEYYRKWHFTTYLDELTKLEELVTCNLKKKKKGFFSSGKKIEYEGVDISLNQESIDKLIFFLLDFYSKHCTVDLGDDQVIDLGDDQIIDQSTIENPYIILMNQFKEIHPNFFKIFFQLQKLKIIEMIDDGFEIIEENPEYSKCDENLKKIITHSYEEGLLVFIDNIFKIEEKDMNKQDISILLKAALNFKEEYIRTLNQQATSAPTQWLDDLKEKLKHLKTEETEINNEIDSHTTISQILAINAESSSPTVKKHSKKSTLPFEKNEVQKIGEANTSNKYNTVNIRNLFKKPPKITVFHEERSKVNDIKTSPPSFSRNNSGG